MGEVRWPLLGRHNVMNALGALAACAAVGVDVASVLPALSAFRSVKRRMELLGEAGGISVYDIRQVTQRKPNPRVPLLSKLTWDDAGWATQHSVPVQYGDRTVLFTPTEGGSGGGGGGFSTGSRGGTSYGGRGGKF